MHSCKITPLVAVHTNPITYEVTAPMRMPKCPHHDIPRGPARLAAQLARKRRIRRVILASKLRVARPAARRGVVREDDDLALRLLGLDARYRFVKPRDVGAMRGDVCVRREALDALEVLQRPGEDVEIFRVERCPKCAAEDG